MSINMTEKNRKGKFCWVHGPLKTVKRNECGSELFVGRSEVASYSSAPSFAFRVSAFKSRFICPQAAERLRSSPKSGHIRRPGTN